MNKKNNIYNLAFGRALRVFRKSKGHTQETLGFAAELDRTYISLLELGERSPTLDTIAALCEALGITLSQLAAAVELEVAHLMNEAGNA